MRVHTPLVQKNPSAQALLQEPQCCTSFVVSIHVPLQARTPRPPHTGGVGVLVGGNVELVGTNVEVVWLDVVEGLVGKVEVVKFDVVEGSGTNVEVVRLKEVEGSGMLIVELSEDDVVLLVNGGAGDE